MPRMKLVSLLTLFICVFALTACGTGSDSYPTLERDAGAQNPNPLSPSDMPAVPTSGTLPPMSQLPEVKVGLLLPLSGPQAGLGNAMLQASQMALFDMGYTHFQLVPRDTAKGAADATRALVQEHVGLILGPVFAEDLRAAQPIAQAANINIISFSTDWQLAGGNSFILGFLPFDQIDRVMGYAAQHGVNNIGVLAPSTDYGNAVVTAYQGSAKRQGIRTTSIERFGTTTDMVQQSVKRFAGMSAQAQGVLMPAGGTQARVVSEALTQNGLPVLKLRRLGTGLFDDQALAQSGALDGAWFAAPSPVLRKNFERRFQDTYNSAPPRLATLSYDATALAAVLAQRGFSNGKSPAFDRTSIINTNGFTGIDGIFRFRANGIAERGLAVLEYDHGQIKVVDPAPQTFQAASF